EPAAPVPPALVGGDPAACQLGVAGFDGQLGGDRLQLLAVEEEATAGWLVGAGRQRPADVIPGPLGVAAQPLDLGQLAGTRHARGRDAEPAAGRAPAGFPLAVEDQRLRRGVLALAGAGLDE